MRTRSSDAYTGYEANELLEAALFALNLITNTRINHPVYPTTYKLAAAIDRHLKGDEA